MLLALTLTIGGLVVLPLAADRFVVSAGRISRALGLSPILVGALLVGFGTSLPEMVVSGWAASKGNVDFAVANVVGSNVANLALVLGAAALVRPIAASRSLVVREGSLVLFVTLLYAVFHLDSEVARWEGLVLFALLVVAVTLLIRWSLTDVLEVVADLPAKVTLRWELLVGVATMALTVGAATTLVEGAERLADELGIQSAFIAATLVAVGTSLPELATAAAAVRRHQSDLALGNVLGSNLFNLLAVGGIAATIAPGPIDSGFVPLLWVLLGLTVVVGALVANGNRLLRWEGMVLLTFFAVFIWLAGANLA